MLTSSNVDYFRLTSFRLLGYRLWANVSHIEVVTVDVVHAKGINVRAKDILRHSCSLFVIQKFINVDLWTDRMCSFKKFRPKKPVYDMRCHPFCPASDVRWVKRLYTIYTSKNIRITDLSLTLYSFFSTSNPIERWDLLPGEKGLRSHCFFWSFVFRTLLSARHWKALSIAATHLHR